MTHEEAQAEAARRRREQPGDGWLVRRAGDGWGVARLPGLGGQTPTAASVESKPRPPQADDPRPAHWRTLGGPYIGGG